MKQFFTLIILLGLVSNINAAENAFDKGAFRIGGNIYYQRFTGDAYRSVTVLTFTPATSYALKKGVFLGINGSIEKSKRSGRESITNWALGPVVEFYFPSEKIEKSFIPYIRLFAMKGESGSSDFQQLGFNIGVIKMINKNIGFDFGISYTFDKIQSNRFIYVPYPGDRYIDDTTRNGRSLLIGIGIESFIF